MSEKLELVPAEPQRPLPVVALDNPAGVVAGMLQAVLDKGITTENVAALKELSGLFERMQNKAAEQQFNRAFVKMKTEMPVIEAEYAVKNNDGTERYRYANLEDIQRKAKPAMEANGFSVSFDQEPIEGKITAICLLRHVGGHSHATRYAVRIGKGPPGANEQQSDESTTSYAQRGAFCAALGIAVRKNNDARQLGDVITPEQARELRQRVLATGANEDAFLRFAQVPPLADNASLEQVLEAYRKIPSSMFSALDANLKRKEKTT